MVSIVYAFLQSAISHTVIYLKDVLKTSHVEQYEHVRGSRRTSLPCGCISGGMLLG